MYKNSPKQFKTHEQLPTKTLEILPKTAVLNFQLGVESVEIVQNHSKVMDNYPAKHFKFY